MLLFKCIFFFIETQIDLNTYSSEFFVEFCEHIHGSNVRALYVHTMQTTHVTFNVTSLDDNFSCMGTTTYHNPANYLFIFSHITFLTCLGKVSNNCIPIGASLPNKTSSGTTSDKATF